MGTSDLAQICSTDCTKSWNPEMHRLAHVSSHVFDAAEKRGHGIQSHAGTVAAFDSAIHLGCVYPGDHACETCSSGSGLVVGVFVRSERNVSTVCIGWRCSVRTTDGNWPGENGHKKGHKTGVNPKNETLVKAHYAERNCKWRRNEWGGTRRNSAA